MTDSGNDVLSEPPKKRRRVAFSDKNLVENKENKEATNETVTEEELFDVGFWLTRSPWLSDDGNEYSLSIDQIITLANENDIIEDCLLFNFKFDLEWLFGVCPILKNDKKINNLNIFHGMSNDQHLDMCEEYVKYFKHIRIYKVKLRYSFGTHHTKMIILKYQNKGLRLCIMTANMIQKDWCHKTNAIYIQDFPLKTKEELEMAYNNTLNKEKFQDNKDKSLLNCEFEEYLYKYCSCMEGIGNFDFSFLKNYDFRSGKVLLVGSVPGYHSRNEMYSYGHLRMRYLLNKYGNYNPILSPIIAQFSSIGSLNEKWLFDEFCQSFLTTKINKVDNNSNNNNSNNNNSYNKKGKIDSFFKSEKNKTSKSNDKSDNNNNNTYEAAKKECKETGITCKSKNNDKIKFIWPTVNAVSQSIEGYEAGGSLCFSQKCNKDFLYPLYHHWDANISNHSMLMPHIKTYCRYNYQNNAVCNNNIEWFLLTSSNMSKAAWGALQKQNSQLFIRSFELGVLFNCLYLNNNKVLKEMFNKLKSAFWITDIPYNKNNLKSIYHSNYQKYYQWRSNQLKIENETKDNKNKNNNKNENVFECLNNELWKFEMVSKYEQCSNLTNDSKENSNDNNSSKDKCQSIVEMINRPSVNCYLPIPHSIYNTRKYNKQNNDCPWIWDIAHFTEDRHGNIWPIE